MSRAMLGTVLECATEGERQFAGKVHASTDSDVAICGRLRLPVKS